MLRYPNILFGVRQGSAGDYVTVDLGHNGCQPWPSSMRVTSPITPHGMPTAFTTDASGTALQPGPESADWQQLLTIHSFEPAVPADHAPDRALSYTFAIPPQNATLAMQAADMQVLASISDVLVQLSQPQDEVLDVSAVFAISSRSCCLDYGLSLMDFIPLADSSFPELPIPSGMHAPSTLAPALTPASILDIAISAQPAPQYNIDDSLPPLYSSATPMHITPITPPVADDMHANLPAHPDAFRQEIFPPSVHAIIPFPLSAPSTNLARHFSPSETLAISLAPHLPPASALTIASPSEQLLLPLQSAHNPSGPMPAYDSGMPMPTPAATELFTSLDANSIPGSDLHAFQPALLPAVELRLSPDHDASLIPAGHAYAPAPLPVDELPSSHAPGLTPAFALYEYAPAMLPAGQPTKQLEDTGLALLPSSTPTTPTPADASPDFAPIPVHHADPFAPVEAVTLAAHAPADTMATSWPYDLVHTGPTLYLWEPLTSPSDNTEPNPPEYLELAAMPLTKQPLSMPIPALLLPKDMVTGAPIPALPIFTAEAAELKSAASPYNSKMSTGAIDNHFPPAPEPEVERNVGESSSRTPTPYSDDAALVPAPLFSPDASHFAQPSADAAEILSTQAPESFTLDNAANFLPADPFSQEVSNHMPKSAATFDPSDSTSASPQAPIEFASPVDTESNAELLPSSAPRHLASIQLPAFADSPSGHESAVQPLPYPDTDHSLSQSMVPLLAPDPQTPQSNQYLFSPPAVSSPMQPLAYPDTQYPPAQSTLPLLSPGLQTPQPEHNFSAFPAFHHSTSHKINLHPAAVPDIALH